jgi:hypothetical protein
VGDKLHLKLNINEIPISKKYREGTMKRTLKRELKGTEIAEREVEGFNCLAMFPICSGYFLIHEHVVEFCGNTGCGCLA